MNLIVNSIGDASCVSLESISNFVKYSELRTSQIYRLDSNDILVFEPKKFFSILTIDYGKCTVNAHRLVNKSNNFLLTHFHLDHYKGFRTGFNIYNKKYSFEKFYYQKLPRIDDRLIDCESNIIYNNDDSKDISISEKKSAFLIVLNNLFCSYENKNVLDIYNIFDYVENGPDNNFIPVGIGDVIEFGQERYNVIWPPKSLDDAEIDKIKDVYDELYNIDESIKNEFKKIL